MGQLNDITCHGTVEKKTAWLKVFNTFKIIFVSTMSDIHDVTGINIVRLQQAVATMSILCWVTVVF